MSGMTSERLTSIRLRLGNARFHLGESDRLVEERSKAYRIPLSGTILDDTADLLAHVDHLTAENARLQAGIKALHGAVQQFEPCPAGPWGCGEPACAEDIRDGERYHDDQPTGRVCLTCRYEDGEPHDWPCGTAALLDPTEGES